MNAPPRTTAVILHWTRPDLTSASVQALLESRPAPSILIVDNGSAAPELADLVRPANRCSLVALPRNAGFTGGMNAGIVRALAGSADFLWLINDDVTVTPDAHGRLVESARREPALWTPRFRSADGREQHVGGIAPLDGTGLRLRDAAGFSSDVDGIRWATGAALFVPAAVVRRLGPLDDRYFAYWEDVDWCVRASRAGVAVRVNREAVVVHEPERDASARSAGRHFLIARNELLFARKHAARATWDRVLARIVARQLRFAGWLERGGQADLARAVLRGGLSGLRGRSGPPRHTWLPDSLASDLLARPLELASRVERMAAARTGRPGRLRSVRHVGGQLPMD